MFAIRVGQLQRSGRVWGARSGPWVAPFRLSLVHPDWTIGGSQYFSCLRGGILITEEVHILVVDKDGERLGTFIRDFGLVSDIPGITEAFDV